MPSESINIMQVNMGKRRKYDELSVQSESEKIDIMALQEPPKGHLKGGTMFAHNSIRERIRASIWISDFAIRKLRPIIMMNLSGSDICVVKIHTEAQSKGVLLISSYMPAEYYLESDVPGETKKTITIHDSLAHSSHQGRNHLR
jgi:endonuclease/exonuclease/phosphatase family metal-dependent hydrolase